MEQEKSDNEIKFLQIARELKDLKKILRDREINEIQILQEINRIQEEIKKSDFEEYQLDNLEYLLKYLFYLLEEIYPRRRLDSPEDDQITSIYEKILSNGIEAPTPRQLTMFKYQELKDLSYEMGDTQYHDDFLEEDSQEKTKIKIKKK